MPFKSTISVSLEVGKKFSKNTSEDAQIMPKESSPRIFVSFIFTGSPSPCHITSAPGSATTTSSSS